MMFDVLGYPPDHPQRAIARRSVEKLLVVRGGRGLLPALLCRRSGTPGSPVMPARGRRRARRRAGAQGLDWLTPKQILDVEGDWAARGRTCVPAAGHSNTPIAHYPDVDDTAVVAMAMDRAQSLQGRQRTTASRSRARANGSSACRARTAAGAPSTPTTTTTISTTSPSPTTARCSIRRPRTSPRAACRCWRSSARLPERATAVARARRLSARARSLPREAGTAAGA